jgi:hypothetical protein
MTEELCTIIDHRIGRVQNIVLEDAALRIRRLPIVAS